VIVAFTVAPSHGLGGNPTRPPTGVTGLGGKAVLVPDVTCPLISQLWASCALKAKVALVMVVSVQVTERVPVPVANAQELPVLYLVGVKPKVKVPDAGAPVVVVDPDPVKV